jgi:hypothetical protein
MRRRKQKNESLLWLDGVARFFGLDMVGLAFFALDIEGVLNAQL